MLHEGRVTAEVFVDFCARLLHDQGDRLVFLVVDGHSTHKARLVRAFVEAQQGRLKPFVLPAYSPHLNPDEQVWATSRRVAKQTVANKIDLKQKVRDALERLRTLPDLIAGFFRHPHCRSILDAQASA